MAALLAVALAAAVALAWTRWWPYGPCPACRRRGKGRGIGSTPAAWRRCGRCGGSGERIRPAALIWPKHRKRRR